MTDFGNVPVGQLAGRVKCAIENRRRHRILFDYFGERRGPAGPRRAVGDKQDVLLQSFAPRRYLRRNDEAESVGIFIAMRYFDWCYPNGVFTLRSFANLHSLPRPSFAHLDVPNPDQLTPGTIAAKKLGHAMRGIYRNTRTIDGLVSQESQAKVMANVGMGEKNPIHGPPINARSART